jgi:hypothetical protein
MKAEQFQRIICFSKGLQNPAAVLEIRVSTVQFRPPAPMFSRSYGFFLLSNWTIFPHWSNLDQSALLVWQWPQGIAWLWLVAVDARAQARRRLRAHADQLHAAAGGGAVRVPAGRREARPLDRARRGDHLRGPTPTSHTARASWRRATRPRGRSRPPSPASSGQSGSGAWVSR